MNRTPLRVLALASVAVLGVAGPALAAGPYTITAGSQSSGTTTVGAVSGQVRWAHGAVEYSCTASGLSGTLELGASGDGTSVADVVASDFEDCVWPVGMPMDVSHVGTWSVDLTGDPTSSRVSGTLHALGLHFENPGGACSYDIDGDVAVVLDDTAQTLDVSPEGGTLAMSNVSGCFGLANDGDPVVLEASYDLTTDAGPVAID